MDIIYFTHDLYVWSRSYNTKCEMRGHCRNLKHMECTKENDSGKEFHEKVRKACAKARLNNNYIERKNDQYTN